MKASECPLVQLFKGPRQFRIPIYQRRYSWRPEECDRLWQDLLRAADESSTPHFIGSVVYVLGRGFQASTVDHLLVIDGQQRLTTVSLLVEALARCLEQGTVSGDMPPRKLRNYYLRNDDEEGDERFKLLLSRDDAATLCALVDQRDPADPVATRLVENFEHFVELISSSGVSADTIHTGLQKLLIVDVALEREHDNPQLIFESLNSTGRELSQSDLLRNYILMGLEPAHQERLYETHWHPMERVLASGDDKTFDRFLRAWLALRRRELVKREDGYEVFKAYHRESQDSIDELVEDLALSAQAYARIALGLEPQRELAAIFARLRKLRIDAPMPFLLHACELQRAGTLSDEDLVEVAGLLENWLFRRAVCDIPSNVLSRTFTAMPGQVDDAQLLESLSALLVLGTGRQVFPTDEEFTSHLMYRNFYAFKHLKYALDRLENEGRKEPAAIDEYTVEHVLPQNPNLSPAWRRMLGADWAALQERYLHVLGNLTLTGYNPELSDRPFGEKQSIDGGFADSPLRLNRSLAKADSWDEAAILGRGRELAERALEIWPRPEVPADVLDRYRKTKAQRKRSGFESIEHFDPTPGTRALYASFEAGLAELGLEPAFYKHRVRVHSPAADTWIWIRLRQRWLGVEVTLPDEDVPLPDIAEPYTWRGGSYIDSKLRDEADVQACLGLIAAILEQEPAEA